MSTPTHALVRHHPLPPALASRLAEAEAALPAPVYSVAEAEAVLADVFLADVDASSVKVYSGRAKCLSIIEFLREIDPAAIPRAAEWLVIGATGARWGKIGGGQAHQILMWLGTCYPIIALAVAKMEALRARARAERVLDRLDALSEKAENESARVKAAEVLLRAYHPAFGHATEAKTGTDRPMVVVNVANILGGDGAESVSKASTIDA